MAAATTKNVTTFSTPSDREILIERTFDAPRHLVWDAWTNPTHLPNWLLGPDGWTMPVCEMDLRPGGAWHFVWRGADGTEMAMTGEYREVSPPERVVSTEVWGGPYGESLNTVVFTEENGRTTMRQTLLCPSQELRDMRIESGMKHGVVAGYNRLDEYLATMG